MSKNIFINLKDLSGLPFYREDSNFLQGLDKCVIKIVKAVTFNPVKIEKMIYFSRQLPWKLINYVEL